MVETFLSAFFPEELPLPAVNGSSGAASLLVILDGRSCTSLIYERTIDDPTLTLQRADDGRGDLALVDQKPGTRWMAFASLGLEDPLEGRALQRILSTYSFLFA